LIEIVEIKTAFMMEEEPDEQRFSDENMGIFNIEKVIDDLDVIINSDPGYDLFTCFHSGAPYTLIDIQKMPTVLQQITNEFSIYENILMESLDSIRSSEFSNTGDFLVSRVYLKVFLGISNSMFLKIIPFCRNYIEDLHNVAITI
jgi:GTP1/Obg family GTP-binding protein